MSQPKASAFFVLPVPGLSIGGVWGNNLSLQFYGFNVEQIIIRHGTKPDIFGTVLPVGSRATPFLAFPRNSIADNQVLFEDCLNRRRRSPVAANIHRGCRLQQASQSREPRFDPLEIIIERTASKGHRAKLLRQVVRRVYKQEIDERGRQPFSGVEKILIDSLVLDL